MDKKWIYHNFTAIHDNIKLFSDLELKNIIFIHAQNPAANITVIKYLMHSLYNQAKDENDSYHQLFLVFYLKFLVSKIRQGNKRKIHWKPRIKVSVLEDEIFYIKMFKESIENYYNVLESSANQFNQESFSVKGSMC